MTRPALLVALTCVLACATGTKETLDLDPSLSAHLVTVGGATIDVRFATGSFALADEVVLEWVTRAATAVNTYFEKAPVEQFTIVIGSTSGSGVSNGVSAVEGRPLIRLDLGRDTTRAQLASDWVLTHEMLHLAQPDVGHRWFEEGMAVYVEPLARARAGQVEAASVLREMVDSYFQGLPKDGDKGLDGTDTWGRSYYGGAIFFLLADIEIRKATHGAKGLEHAFRQIVAEGGTVGAMWTVDRALAAGDRGVGVPVLVPLGERWRGAPVAVDLDAVFRELGVELRRGEVVLHDDAPLAGVRRGLFPRSP